MAGRGAPQPPESFYASGLEYPDRGVATAARALQSFQEMVLTSPGRSSRPAFGIVDGALEINVPTSDLSSLVDADHLHQSPLMSFP